MNSRNVFLDNIKGITIVLVCLEHIIQAVTYGYESSIFYNFIFAVQMPVFFIVSGYLTKNISTGKELMSRCGKRIVSYLIPFFSRIIIFNYLFNMTHEALPEKIVAVMKNVDIGLWFLWVLFFLCLSGDVSGLVASKVKNSRWKFIVECFGFGITLTPWLFLLGVLKCQWLGSKLIVYYSIFFFAGKILKHYLPAWKCNKKAVKDIGFVLSAIIGGLIISHFSLRSDYDGLSIILLRVISGFTLSYVLLFVVKKYNDVFSKLGFNVLGRYTLEIYYVHGIATSLFAKDSCPPMYSLEGGSLIAITSVVMVIFTTIVISIIKTNWITDLIFFGKRSVKKRV